MYAQTNQCVVSEMYSTKSKPFVPATDHSWLLGSSEHSTRASIMFVGWYLILTGTVRYGQSIVLCKWCLAVRNASCHTVCKTRTAYNHTQRLITRIAARNTV